MLRRRASVNGSAPHRAATRSGARVIVKGAATIVANQTFELATRVTGAISLTLE